MSKRLSTAVVCCAAVALLSVVALAQPKPASVPYKWKSVQIVGGGFVDGIIFHPTAKDVRYARTDMGGAYRWEATSTRWQPILDWMPYEDTNLMGVESIALDPNDPDRVYLACGTYTFPGIPDGAILRSSDRGKTFQRTNVPIKFGGNENGRGNGERMAVDPNDGRILILGTRHAGLWISKDGAATWSRIESFPNVDEKLGSGANWWEAGSGINLVIFDPRSGKKGQPSSTIYVAVSLMGRDNLFRSSDGGATWKPVPGAPTQYRPTHGVLASDGTLYLSYGDTPGPSRMTNGAVWKLDTKTDTWTEISPEKQTADKHFGYAAVSVDAHDPKVLIVSTFNRPLSKALEDDIYRSTDGGATWKPVFASGGTFDYALAPYAQATPLHWMFDIEIDPTNPDHAMFTTGYGGWEAFNLTAMDSGKPTRWSIMASGIEEIVAAELLSPPRGAHLVSGIFDYGGFVHWDLDKPVAEGESQPPFFDGTTGVAAAESKPELIVRVGKVSAHHKGGNISYSLDSGRTWHEPESVPQGAVWGNVAVSSDGATWLWAPEKLVTQFTRDLGRTWSASKGLPAGTRVIADRVNPRRFYGMDLFGGKLFTSDDSGATFAAQPLVLPDGLPQKGNRGDNRGGQDRIYAAPGREGELWIAAFNGLYHSTDSGKTFTRTSGVTEIQGFGFGKGAPGKKDAALYLVGVINGQRGFFRSIDSANTWVRINDDQHQYGLVLHITGDPKRYGRVYVGTHGRGILYGDPAGK